MSKKRKIIMGSDSDLEAVQEEREGSEIESDDSELDFSEVIRRNDDIDQLTADYIMGLMGLEDFAPEDIGLDTETLDEIEDAFEEVLDGFGFTIYRPTIVEDENGFEHIVHSRFADDDS